MTNTQLAQRAGGVSHVRVRVRTSAQDTSKREASPSRYSAQHTSKKRHHVTCLQRTSRGVTCLCTTHVMGSVTLLCKHMSRKCVTLPCRAHVKSRRHVTLHSICQEEESRYSAQHMPNGGVTYCKPTQHTTRRSHDTTLTDGKGSRHDTTLIHLRQRQDTTLAYSKGSRHDTTLTDGSVTTLH